MNRLSIVVVIGSLVCSMAHAADAQKGGNNEDVMSVAAGIIAITKSPARELPPRPAAPAEGHRYVQSWPPCFGLYPYSSVPKAKNPYDDLRPVYSDFPSQR